jgi:nitrite reductase/ring-hydroxylating ferredoxin subunit
MICRYRGLCKPACLYRGTGRDMASGEWTKVASRSALAPGAMIGVEVGDTPIALYNIDGEIFATENMCTHAFATLTDGLLDGDVVECPLHGGCFKVKTGEGLGPPVPCDLKTFATRVVGDEIEVKI